MPLVDESNPFTDAPDEPVYEVKIAPKDYRHSIVNTRETPIDSLIVHMEGMPVKVDYYSQVLGSDDELQDYNPSYDGPDQQYQLIKNLEMKLQAPLSNSFNDEENRVTISGTALTYPGLKPNTGDVIILDIGDGRAGQFTVTGTSQKSIYKNTIYEIDFTLRSILTGTLEKQLNENVVSTSYFNKDFLVHGQNPVISSSAYQARQLIDAALRETLGSWVVEFFSYTIQTMRVPTASGVVYDPFITNLIVNAFGTNGHPVLAQVQQYDCGSATLDGYLDIWSAMLRGEKYILKAAFKEYRLVPTKLFRSNVYLRSVKYSGITHIVLPHVSNPSNNDPLDVLKYKSGLLLTDSGTLTQETMDKRAELDIQAPVLADSPSYLMSRDAYELTGEPLTRIEQQVMNYFGEIPVDHHVILDYVNNRNLLTPLERFYLMPVCLLMLIHCLRSL